MKKFGKILPIFLTACFAFSFLSLGACKEKEEAPSTEPFVEPSVSVEPKEPIMPVAFLAGVEYEIPQAVYLDEEGNELAYSVYMTDDAGKESLLSGSTFKPSVTLHGKNISLRYEAEEKILGEFFVPVLNAVKEDNGKKYYDFDKLFILNGVESSQVTENGAVFYGNRDFFATYANMLDASFNVQIKSVAGYDNFENVTVDVADAYDPSVKIRLSVRSTDDKTSTLSVNGQSARSMSGSVKDFKDGFKLSFHNGAAKIYDALNTEISSVNATSEGKEFKGFPSGFVNISIGISNPRSTSAVCVAQMNNQGMDKTASCDAISPFVVCGEDIVMLNDLNENIKIPKAISYDVLDPSVKTTVSVYTPSGELAESVNGEELFEIDARKAYFFKAKALGEYTIQYSATDSNGNKYDNAWYSVFVIDSVAPTLSVKNPVKNNVSLGSTITISSLQYSDDCSQTEKINVLITINFPNGDYKTVNSGDKFTFEMKGKYYFRYTVIDEYYNMTTVSQTVTCK